ncbi:curli production protein csgc precursor [Citrobacter koseri]|uniref:Curli production protein csgc n=1 Tax=Citrobacter koseri TaxID=545 RepID=A0A2X2XNC6_CITKO|nr:curli production protein csgc precursor [Citrobacter koseri]
MNTLLLLAALSSQITFNTTQQGEIYTIVPPGYAQQTLRVRSPNFCRS